MMSGMSTKTTGIEKTLSETICTANYESYVAKLFANTIATIPPKITISNEYLANKFTDLITEYDLQELNYNLVYNLSKNGKLVLGLMCFNKKPKILLIRPSFLEINLDNEITVIEGDSINFDNVNIKIKKDNRNKKQFKYTFTYTILNTSKKYEAIDYTQIYNNIPFLLIGNNPTKKADLAEIDKNLLKAFDAHLDLLITDSLGSKSIFHINMMQNTASLRSIDKLNEVIFSPSKLVYLNDNILSLLQSGGLQIQQSASNYQSLLEKLKFYDNKIRDLAFLPRSTLDAGTKNIHSTEASTINSNADDYIELKANLLEHAWKYFIKEIVFDYLKENAVDFPQETDIKQVNIDVEIAGSTKYLKNRANEYVQNQQGTLINPNQINTATQEGGDSNARYDK